MGKTRASSGVGSEGVVTGEAARSVPGMSRRAALGSVGGAVAGAVAGMVGSALLEPKHASANDGTFVAAGSVVTAEHATGVKYDGSNFSGIVFQSNDSSYTITTWYYAAALAGFAGAALGSGANAGHAGVPNGVHGYTENGVGYGVVGVNDAQDTGKGGAGVYGYSANTNGSGVMAQNGNGGLALRVAGRGSYETSGRVNIPANATYVDVFVPSGLATANILAMLQYPRSGVWVRACRRNYPSLDYVRIYLNKVASTTAGTPVAWFVFEGPPA